ncbi:MAG: mevalonate kinase [Patescibacteria group bacterium]|nr:mevalonate kinase [Patescibacteria group bacterium]
MNKIKVSTPGKLMLFGDHSVVYNRPCIVASVDQRFEVVVEKIKGKEMVVQAPGVGIYDYRKDLNKLGETRITKELRFVEVVVREFYSKRTFGGIKIKTKNHFSSEHGFGSSAAVTVGLSKALFELKGIKISNKKLFDFCYKVVLDVQGVGSGFDVAAALYGGVLYFVTGGRKIEKIKVPNFLTSESSEPSYIVVGYTGIKADTPTLVRQVAELKRHDPEKIEKCFDEITKIVKKAKISLEKKDWKRAGELMNENQVKLEELGVSSVELDNLIKAAREAGAYGAKLSGAGGGDCMLAVVNKKTKDKVEKAIEDAGGEVMRVKLGAEGAKIE